MKMWNILAVCMFASLHAFTAYSAGIEDLPAGNIQPVVVKAVAPDGTTEWILSGGFSADKGVAEKSGVIPANPKAARLSSSTASAGRTGARCIPSRTPARTPCGSRTSVSCATGRRRAFATVRGAATLMARWQSSRRSASSWAWSIRCRISRSRTAR